MKGKGKQFCQQKKKQVCCYCSIIMVRDIHAMCWEELFSDHVSRSVGNEKHSLFWSDAWLGRVSFRVRFNRLYELSLFKGASVFDICQLGWG